MKLIEQLKNLFGPQKPKKSAQTDPTKPNLDVKAWLEEVQEVEAQSPNRPGIREMRAIGLGFSDVVTPEQKVEQQRRWQEMQSQEEETNQLQANQQH